MNYKTNGNTITLKLDELFNNSVSPETIADEVKKAAAEYYAETAAKEKAKLERDNKLTMARENVAFNLLSWYEDVKDIEIEDSDYDKLYEAIVKRLVELEDIAILRNYNNRPNAFADQFLSDLWDLMLAKSN